MTDSGRRQRRALELFEAIVDLDAEQRVRAIEEACGSDAELRAAIDELLQYDADASTRFLEPPTVGPRPPEAELPGGLVLGDYVLIELLGRGGMGVVYRARHQRLGSDFAVKVLTRGLGTQPSEIRRFYREVRAAAKLQSPDIVQVLNEGVEGATHWFAMELVEGHDLRREIDIHREVRRGQRAREATALLPVPGQPDRVRAVVQCVAQAADALQRAHAEGIIHRDIKPSNLMLNAAAAPSDCGRTKLADFGLARDATQESLTQSGGLVGTPHYMSPEQARVRASSLDQRTDVYSLGVVLYELLTLTRPFDGETDREVLSKICEQRPVPVRRVDKKVPVDLATVCETAMAYEPGDRYETASAFAGDLRRFLSFESIEARRPNVWQVAKRYVRRNHRLVGAITGTLIAMAATTWWLVSAVQAGEIRERLEPVRAAANAQSLNSWSVEDLVIVRDRIRALEGRVARDDQRLLDATRARLRQVRLDWQRESRAELAAGSSAITLATDPERGFRHFEAASRRLTQLHALFPESLRRGDQSVFQPLVSIVARNASGVSVLGRVWSATFAGDTTISERELLGPLPLERAPVHSGYVRFLVDVEGLGQRELTRHVLPGQQLDLTLQVRTDQQNLDTLRVDGATFRYPDTARYNPLRGRDVTVASFEIGKHEVSVAEYGRFLAATGHSAPNHWEFMRQFPDHPIVNVTWLDARTYAEWAGYRLPTLAEWWLVARGTEGRKFPLPGQDAFSTNTLREPLMSGQTVSDYEARFRDDFMAVRSDVAAARAERPHHLHGNAAEWVETVVAVPVGESFVPDYPSRYVLGGAIDAQRLRTTLDRFGKWPVGPGHFDWKIGFRVARTLP